MFSLSKFLMLFFLENAIELDENARKKTNYSLKSEM